MSEKQDTKKSEALVQADEPALLSIKEFVIQAGIAATTGNAFVLSARHSKDKDAFKPKTFFEWEVQHKTYMTTPIRQAKEVSKK